MNIQKLGLFAVPANNLQAMLDFASKSIQGSPSLYSQFSQQEDSTHMLAAQMGQWKKYHPEHLHIQQQASH